MQNSFFMQQAINEALKAAEKAKLSIEQLKLNNEILIKEANLERDKILKDAISVKKSMIENAEKEAKNVKSKIMLDSKISINREKKLAIIALKNYSAELSLKIAKKLLRRELSNEKSQKDLINSILNKK
jgi:F-type H+-transporting ATPase subunit b